MELPQTGGCQCGGVRYEIRWMVELAAEAPDHVAIGAPVCVQSSVPEVCRAERAQRRGRADAGFGCSVIRVSSEAIYLSVASHNGGEGAIE